MKAQPPLNRKWTLIYSLAIIVLVLSIYFLTLPLDTKLRLFCTIDNAHIAENPPTHHRGYWRTPYTIYVNGYWTNPATGTNLTVITIWEAIDAGTWLYYDNTQNTFWITIQHGPMKNTTYGPYQGNLWTLTNTINAIALTGITLSTIALVYRPLDKLWTKTHNHNRKQPKKSLSANTEEVVNVHAAQTTTSKPTPPPTSKKLL